jgi:hypothetical protein
MSYWDDPDRKAAALQKRAATRAELGPRLGQAPFRGYHAVAPPKPGGPARRGFLGPDHPTRDTPA